MTDRGVSNILGYVLMFAIIITATLSIAILANDQLESVQSDEQLSNAERGFQILGQNIGEIQTSRAAVRSGTVDLNGGQIGLTSGTDSTIRVQVSGSNDDYDERIPVRSLVYTLDGTEVAYEGGAVFRRDNTIGIMKQQPHFRCTDDSAFVSIVTLRGDSASELGGGSISVRTAENASRLRFPINRSGPNSTDGESTVTIDVADMEFPDGWVRYLEGSSWNRVGSTTQFECRDVQTYYVRQSVIDTSLVQ